METIGSAQSPFIRGVRCVQVGVPSEQQEVTGTLEPVRAKHQQGWSWEGFLQEMAAESCTSPLQQCSGWGGRGEGISGPSTPSGLGWSVFLASGQGGRSRNP